MLAPCTIRLLPCSLMTLPGGHTLASWLWDDKPVFVVSPMAVQRQGGVCAWHLGGWSCHSCVAVEGHQVCYCLGVEGKVRSI